MITEFLLFMSSILGISWSLIFLISGLIGISVFKLSGQKMQSFQREIKYASIWNNEEPEGWFVGYWYIGYISKMSGSRGDTSNYLFIICTKKFYNCKIANDEDGDEDEDEYKDQNQENVKNTKECQNIGKKHKKNKANLKFNMFHREGSYWNLSYSKSLIKCTELIPRINQQNIITHIHNEYEKQHFTSVLLYGEPGKGKSIIPFFLAKYMLENNDKTFANYAKISIVDTFNPTHPGDYFIPLYNKVSPTHDAPLIVIIEEVDIIIKKIHNNLINTHPDIPTLITNKSEWNTFFDRFERGLYPYVIIIMTTNQSISYFDELDPSYMRYGRVNIKYHMN